MSAPAKIRVRAREGLSVPMENSTRRITTPITVTSSAYYRRQIADGDLVVVEEQAP